MVIQYKCPNCGSDLTFDSQSGRLVCQSCGQSMSIDQVPKSETSSSSGEIPPVDMFNPNDIPDENTYQYEYEEHSGHTQFNTGEVNEYHCNNCGAVILTDSDTTATTCSYCGSPVLLSDRLSGTLAPAKVIPFKISRDEAQAKFKKWCKNGRFTPNEFKNADRVKHITGMYVPFWLYDVNGCGDVDATCTRVRRYTRGEYEHIETSYFHVYRKFDLHYLKVPVDASEKMNDELMDKMEPYNYQDLKPFNMPYLAGYLAEKYNYNDTDCYPRCRERIAKYIDAYIASTMSGYSTTRYNRKDIHINPRNTFYTLLPVWMVYYDYKDSEHVFAMNGQTGKIVGKPPLSKSKIARWMAGISACTFIVFKAVTLLLGGPLL